MRTLLIHGGRTVVRVADKYKDKRNRWISELDQRRGKNISAVAVANKNACDACRIRRKGLMRQALLIQHVTRLVLAVKFNRQLTTNIVII